MAAVLAMQSQDVEGDIGALRETRDEDMEDSSGDVDDDMNGLMAPTISYDRAMSPEPFDTLSREDQNLVVLDQWEDWADIVSGIFSLTEQDNIMLRLDSNLDEYICGILAR